MLLGGAALLLGESNTKDTQKISVGSLGINMGLNQGLPLLHHGTKLVGGEVHTVELCQAILALHIFAYKLKFLVRPLCVLKINTQRSIMINAFAAVSTSSHLQVRFANRPKRLHRHGS